MCTYFKYDPSGLQSNIDNVIKKRELICKVRISQTVPITGSFTPHIRVLYVRGLSTPSYKSVGPMYKGAVSSQTFCVMTELRSSHWAVVLHNTYDNDKRS